MPKMKTKKSAAKRFKITGSGNISYSKGGNSHFGVRKSSKRKEGSAKVQLYQVQCRKEQN